MSGLAYRMEVHTTAQIADQDPFGGHGRRMELSRGMSQEEQTAYMQERCPDGGWVIVMSHAWVDTRALCGR